MTRKKAPPPLEVPPQTDAAAWTRMLAAARAADKLAAVGTPEKQVDPLTAARLRLLFPVTRALYDEKVLPFAEEESRRISAVIANCVDLICGKESLPPHEDTNDQLDDKDSWSNEKCREEMDRVLVPATLKLLLPVPPAVIGLQLIPRTQTWRLLRVAVHRDILPEDIMLKMTYNKRMQDRLHRGEYDLDVVQPLRGVRFVDNVLGRAPPLVCSLPSNWSAADKTDALLEALQALLELVPTRPLASFINRLTNGEYRLLAAEHDCVSQLLSGTAWTPICADGRNLEEYKAFLRYLQQADGFKGSLAGVPRTKSRAKAMRHANKVAVATAPSPPVPVPRRVGRPKGSTKARVSNQQQVSGTTVRHEAPDHHLKRAKQTKFHRSRLGNCINRHKLCMPAQSNTVAWARMLAAARGADRIESEGMETIDSHPHTWSRMRSLLPVANELYEKSVHRKAVIQSQRIDDILGHCHEYLGAAEWVRKELGANYKLRDLPSWDKEQCEREVEDLLVPVTLRALRPAPPDAIGLHFVPHSPMWRLLRIAIHRGFSKADSRQSLAYNKQMRNAVGGRRIERSELQPLSNVSFVDAVLERAPPLVRVLPPPWTAAEKTNFLIEALLALLNMGLSRPLGPLMEKLSADDNEVLAEEHSCLSQLLLWDTWKPRCSKGRNLQDYMAFLRFLRQDGNFTGTLADVPLADVPLTDVPLTDVPLTLSQEIKVEQKRKSSSSSKSELSFDVESAVDFTETGAPEAVLSGSEWLPRDSCKRQRLDDLHQASCGVAIKREWSYEYVRQFASDGEFSASEGLVMDADDDCKLFSDQFIHLTDPAANEPTDWFQALQQLPGEQESDRGVSHQFTSEALRCKLERPPSANGGNVAMDAIAQSASDVILQGRPSSGAGGFLVHSDGASTISGIAIVPLGAVATLGLVLLVVALAFRVRARRV